MQYDLMHRNIENENDPAKLKAIAHNLLKCLGPFPNGAPYVAVKIDAPSVVMHEGTRNECLAFIYGYVNGDDPHGGLISESLAVCVNTPCRMIVIPEDRFGHILRPNYPKTQATIDKIIEQTKNLPLLFESVRLQQTNAEIEAEEARENNPDAVIDFKEIHHDTNHLR